MAAAATLWRPLWLQTSGIPAEVHQIIKDLPVEGSNLFPDKNGEVLRSLKDSQVTLYSLMFYMLHPRRKCSRL